LIPERQNILGIIPARGGSKGIPRKNIRPLNSRPLIYYSIQAAQESKLLTHWIVSTEDTEINRIAETLGAKVVPRPGFLAMDETPMLPVIQHTISSLPHNFDTVFILQPTCPLRTGNDIDGAIRTHIQCASDSVVSVYRVEDTHPGRMYRIEKGNLKPYASELISLNRQDLPHVYHRNGALYGTRTDIVMDGSLYGNTIVPYIMPRERSLNIDDPFDWQMAECILKQESRDASHSKR
jgi:CMP-N,N'-diacetyllegionaminic acid synthase